MKKIQKGFTLIELMIVVAIIGILAAVAIPSYQDYITKAKLSKVSGVIDPIKTAIALYYQENGGFITSTGSGGGWTSLGITTPTTTTEVSAIAMSACTGTCNGQTAAGATDLTGASANMLYLTLDKIKTGSINSGIIIMRPNVTSGGTNMTWSNFCTAPTVPAAAAMDSAVLKYFQIPGTTCAPPF